MGPFSRSSNPFIFEHQLNRFLSKPKISYVFLNDVHNQTISTAHLQLTKVFLVLY